MFVAREKSEPHHLVALPGASTADQTLARIVNGTEANHAANTDELRCADAHCDAPVRYRVGPGSPHWYHLPGTAGDCAESKAGGEGAWHRFVCRDLLGGAAGYEHRVPGARVDVVVRRTQSERLTAIEVQHSRISYDEVLTRHTAHAAADRLDGTVWIVDAPKVGVVDGVAWRTDGNPGLVLTTPWVLDILKACQDTPEPHRSTVGFLVPNAVGGSYGLRFVDSIEWGHTADGARSATVRKWTDRVGQATIREWSKGPGRVLDPRMEHPRRILDAAATRRVKDWIYNRYKVA